MPGVFIPQLFAGGLGDFDRLTTLFALLNMSPTINLYLYRSHAGFVVAGGCQGIYNGMEAYLGGQTNVLVNARVLYAARPVQPGAPVTIGGTVWFPPSNGGGSGGVNGSFAYKCGKLVVAYAQLLVDMVPLGLDATEARLFGQVRKRYYFTGDLTAGGPLATNGSFNMLNLDPTTTFGTPSLPAITQLTRGLPYGPIQFKASSDARIEYEGMAAVVGSQLRNMPSSLLTDAVVDNLIQHVFQPFFTNAELAKPGGAYGALDALQGYRNTYYLGSLKNFAVTLQLWNAAYELVQTYF